MMKLLSFSSTCRNPAAFASFIKFMMFLMLVASAVDRTTAFNIISQVTSSKGNCGARFVTSSRSNRAATTKTELNNGSGGMDAYDAQMRALSRQQQQPVPQVQVNGGQADDMFRGDNSVGVGAAVAAINDDPSSSSSSSSHHNILEKEYFQLEELEDSESCTTEIFLQSDGEVVIGQTDGPLFINAKGSWILTKDNKFRMSISRSYKTGQSGTDMGEFIYNTERIFLGEITSIGSAVGIAGGILPADANIDFAKEEEIDPTYDIGYFSMIDTTSARNQQLGLGSGDDDDGDDYNFMSKRSSSSR